MKKAKVKDGLVLHVWPGKAKKMAPDGTKYWVETTLPAHYLKRPDLLIEVPDDVKPGWVWNGEKYAPRVKEVPVRKQDPMLSAMADMLGLDYNEIVSEAKKRKKLAVTKAK